MECKRLGRTMSVVASLAIASAFANAASAPTIYRCIENEVVTYSDRPCGSSASEYHASERISILDVAPPAATKPARVKPKPARVNTASIAAAQAKHAENCAKLERSLRDIRSKMRAGYDAKEGERLRDRQRELTARQHDLRC